MTNAVAEAMVRHGQTVQKLDDLHLPKDAGVPEIMQAAKAQQLDILTTDAGLPQTVYEQDIWFPRSIVFLQLEGGDVEQDDAIDRLFERYKRLTPRRLYTVTTSRVKVRQLPGRE